jgi:hypothetical protein
VRKSFRFTLPAALFVTALLLFAAAGIAASPHFKKGGEPTCRDTGTQLSCSGSLAGLGNESVDIVLTADAQASFACVNPGGNESPGQNKVPFTATGSQHFDASEIKNGNLSFTVAAPTTPPTATAEQAGCPNGNWSTRLTSVDFTNIRLTISQGGVLLFTCTRSGPVPTSGSVALSCS